MKTKTYWTVLIGLCLALLPLGAFGKSAEPDPIKSHPGYLGLENVIQGFEHHVTLEFDLGPLSAKLGALLLKEKDPEFAEVLSTIKFVHTIEFEVEDKDDTLALQKANELFDMLASGEWSSLVKIRTDDNKLQVSALMNDEGVMHAVALVSLDGNSLTIVNVGGDLDLAKIVRIGQQYNIEELEELGEIIDEA